MAESHKFKTLADATAVWSDLPWQADAGGGTFVFDEKSGDYVPVSKGQYIVKIGNRFEVHDEEPEKAKPAEAPKAAEKKDSAKTENAEKGTSGIEGAEPAPAE